MAAVPPEEEDSHVEDLVAALVDGASLGRVSLERAARACPPALIHGLSRRGFLTRSRLAVVAVQEDSFQVDIVRDFLSEDTMKGCWRAWADLLEAARACTLSERGRGLTHPREERSLQVALWQQAKQVISTQTVDELPPPPTAEWPIAKRRRAGAQLSLDEQEEEQRGKLLTSLGEEIRELLLPAAAWLQGDNFHRRVLLLGKGLRLATLRARIRSWRHMRRWLEAAKEVSWPRAVSDVLEYLECRAAEPCGRTCFSSALLGLAFMEQAGQLPRDQRLGASEFLQASADELVRTVQKQDPREKRQAQQIPISVIAAWERAVMCGDIPRYARFWAWARLLKVWGGPFALTTLSGPTRPPST